MLSCCSGRNTACPRCRNAEIVLYHAPGTLSRTAELLAEHIVHSLENPAGAVGAEAGSAAGASGSGG